MNHRGDKSGNRHPRSPRRACPQCHLLSAVNRSGTARVQCHLLRLQLEAVRREPSGNDRKFQHPSPDGSRRTAKSRWHWARPVGAQGSQLHHTTNTPAAPDGLAPSELKVPSYTTPPTPLKPPTGLPRRSSRFAATPRRQHHRNPRRIRAAAG